MTEILSMNTTNKINDIGAALMESNMHREEAWLCSKNVDSAFIWTYKDRIALQAIQVQRSPAPATTNSPHVLPAATHIAGPSLTNICRVKDYC